MFLSGTPMRLCCTRCNSLLALILVSVFVVGLLTTAEAATTAGTVIKNQASASYRDTQGVRRTTTSNLVETVIRQVAAIELNQNQSKPVTAGTQVYFTHTVVNTGNGSDRVVLAADNIGGDDFDLDNLEIYRDDNRDGQPDSFTPVSLSKLLAPGESQSLVVAGVVPVGITSGLSALVAVEGTSEFDSSVRVSNTDIAVTTDSAVIELSKTISTLQGSSPDGPFTVRVLYRNTGTSVATDVTLIDALPSGMSYVPGSGRWSESGSLVLTDVNPNDSQSAGILYCAYDSSCVNLPEANSDVDALSSNQVTAVLVSVQPDESGYIEFQVSIDSDLSSSVLFNTAETEYSTSAGVSGRISSNSVPFRIVHGASVVINGSVVTSADGTGEPLVISESVFGASSNLPECQSASADPDGDGFGTENGVSCIVLNVQSGNTVFFRNTVWNRGNSEDIFDINTINSDFPEGTLFRILQSDGQTPLLDNSGNGIVDTGPLAPGAFYQITVQAVIPSGTTGDNGGANFEFTSVATSVSDSSVNNTMLNRLLSITEGGVDITNVAALGDPLSTGVGAGPEATPVSAVSVAPGESAVIDLYINNTSAFPMAFDLSSSIHSDFSSIELPVGWQLQFLLSDNTVVSNTGVIQQNESLLVRAQVSVSDQSVPAVVSLYFKAANERFDVEDIKHDQVSVTGEESLILGINQEGQASAGGSHVYSHLLSNAGDTDVSNITLSVSDSLSVEGWNSIVFEDTDGDGMLGVSDQTIEFLPLLAAGETKMLFVKVFVPGTAPDGLSNSTVLTSSWSSGSLSVTDITNVSAGEISVTKEQALDAGCDGVLDSVFSSNGFAVEPGNNCVKYRLIATNAGSEAVLNVVVADATPTFTSYFGSADCSHSNCSITEPFGGGQGDIIASLPELVAGDSVVVEFVVRID